MATQGSPLTPELKRAIVLLKDYFDRTQDDVREQDYSSAERAAHALGVGIATVKRVMADFHRSPDVLDRGAAQRRGRPPRAIADSLQTMTRDYGRQANREGTHMTLEMVAERLREGNALPTPQGKRSGCRCASTLSPPKACQSPGRRGDSPRSLFG